MVTFLGGFGLAKPVPWMCRQFGDREIDVFYMPRNATLDVRRRLKALFPEAQIRYAAPCGIGRPCRFPMSELSLPNTFFSYKRGEIKMTGVIVWCPIAYGSALDPIELLL